MSQRKHQCLRSWGLSACLVFFLLICAPAHAQPQVLPDEASTNAPPQSEASAGSLSAPEERLEPANGEVSIYSEPASEQSLENEEAIEFIAPRYVVEREIIDQYGVELVNRPTVLTSEDWQLRRGQGAQSTQDHSDRLDAHDRPHRANAK